MVCRFGHKLPKSWLAPPLDLHDVPRRHARCEPREQPFEHILTGAECCSRDLGSNIRGSARNHSRLIHHTNGGYADAPSGCQPLCLRLGCSFFSWSGEWNKCTFCDGHQCPFAVRHEYRTRWSNKSSVFVRRQSPHFEASRAWWARGLTS